MISLPEFTNPNPTDDELWVEQDRLQIQAQKVLDLGILELMRKYGEIEIGGSFKYGLMVYPDIDTSNIFINDVNLDVFADICSEVVRQPYVRKISTGNTHDFGTLTSLPRPDGYWLGIQILFEGDAWGIDTWVMDPKWIGNKPGAQKSLDYGEDLSELDEATRTSILRMKYMAIYERVYGSVITSGMVYDAVLDHEITTYEELKKFYKVD